MAVATWEVPDVAWLEVVGFRTALRIDNRGANAAADDARALDPADPKNTRAAQRALMADAERDALKTNVLGGLSGIAVMSGVALLLLATDGPLGGDIAVLPTTDGLGVGGVF